eukprot:TRINITY_DN127202_c1_g2_i1.p1 TRINITY_DN127202_c1_g2~~TRINITY_DN127202_c1_g2_i1.p1  ORF type:complete len:613 (+),score=181.20 TRINITY_DN127202_c1_g2_i1:94-1932(+)
MELMRTASAPLKRRNGARSQENSMTLPKLSKTASMEMSRASTGSFFNSKRELWEIVRSINPERSVAEYEMLGTSAANLSPALRDPNASASKLHEKEASMLDDGVNDVSRRYNSVHNLVKRKRAQLQEMADKLNEITVENNQLREMSSNKTRDHRHISHLHKEVTNVQDSIDRRTDYSKRLDHMCRRLRNNEIAFTAHIDRMQDALENTDKEREEVLLLTKELEGSKEKALEDIEHFAREWGLEKLGRTIDRDQLQLHADISQRMVEWRTKRDELEDDLQKELSGGMSVKKAKKLKEKLEQRKQQATVLKEKSRENTQEAMTMEEAFRKVQQLTGVVTLNDMINKFLGQDVNKAQLEQEKKEAETRLARVRNIKAKFEKQFLDIKSNGFGGTELNREMYDKLDEQILEVRNNLKVQQGTSNRLDATLLAVRQGAMGIQQRLAPISSTLNVNENELDLPSDSPSVRSLMIVEAKLMKMLESVNVARVAQTMEEDETKRRRSKQDDLTLHHNNIRIRPPSATADGFALSVMDSDGEAGSDEESDEDSTMAMRVALKTRSTRRTLEEQRRKDKKGRRDHPEGKPPKAIKRATSSHRTVTDNSSKSAFFLTAMPDLV